jgi:hypothetical protein
MSLNFQVEAKSYATLPMMFQPYSPYPQYIATAAPAPIHYPAQMTPLPTQMPAQITTQIAPQQTVPIQRPVQTDHQKVVVLGMNRENGFFNSTHIIEQ